MGEIKETLQKYRTPIIIGSFIFLLVLCTAMGHEYGKRRICEKSSGVLAELPNYGEVCVTQYASSKDCAKEAPVTIQYTYKYCKDDTGLYPVR